MEATEIKTALDGIKSQFDAKGLENQIELKGLIANLEGKMATNEAVTELKTALDVVQAHADALDVKLKEKSGETEIETKSFFGEFAKSLKLNFEVIKNVRKGAAAKMEMKAVGDMTATANLTGGTVKTYQAGVVAIPSQKVNFSDLVATVNSATGTYVIYRETGSEGSISNQTVPGTSKTQIDYDFTEVVFNATYLAGFARYAKQMAQDLPFLTSFLPNALRRDYLKKENSIFYTALAAAATASTTAKTVDIEQIVDDMGTLEATDYECNGIVMNPKDWYAIALTKPSNYSLPQTVSFLSGVLTINGCPVYKASWMPVDKYLMGDWNYAKKVAVDGLAIEFFEQDADNVTKNLITARIEQRTVLGIDNGAAFILGDFGNVI